MTQVTLDHLTKTYPGADEPAVYDFSLDSPDSSITAVLGPSGSGKSTILKIISGLIAPTSGDVLFDGKSVLNVPAEKRSAVMVFQNHALFPYMTVEQNVGFGLKMRGVDKKTIKQRVAEMLELVRLPNVGSRSPRQLSGGQQQRIALARALITEPRLLLLDEPLSSLDVHLRDEMRDLILDVQRRFGITTVIVTHDQQEAVLLADKIALVFDGVLQQYAAPATFYRCPATEQVARFFGGVNFLKGRWDGEYVRTRVGLFRVTPTETIALPHGDVMMTIRPEQIHIGETDGENTFSGHIVDCTYMGASTRYKVAIGEVPFEVIRTADLPGEVQSGQPVSVHFPPSQLWLLPQES